MIKTSSLPDQAEIGRDNAMAWLMAHIVECLLEPMDDTIAQRLAIYDSAYHVLTRTDEEKQSKRRFDNIDHGDRLSDAEIQDWISNMQNEDGTTGPHFSMDQARQTMAQNKISGIDPKDFYLTLNMMYSDYLPVAKRMNCNNIQFYVSMVRAFLEDKDAAPNKLANYYRSIVNG